MRLLCAEEDVGNLKKCTFRNYWTPVSRTRRRKSQKMHFQEFWDSCAQNKTSEIPKNDFQEIWDSCAQNKASEISKNGLSGFLGLLCAEQDVGNLKKCIFGISGTHKTSEISKKMHFQEFWDSCAQNKASEISKNGLSGILGLLCAEQDVGNLKKCISRNSGTHKTSEI